MVISVAVIYEAVHNNRKGYLPMTIRLFCVTAALSLTLSACGGGNDAADADKSSDKPIAQKPEAEAPKVAAAAIPNLSNGPDVCFRAIAKHIGADTKVSEITSFFSAGSAVDSDDEEPQGQMTTCTVQYQSPEDPRKLVGTRLDIETGEFAPPSPVEITVMGNAATFNLEDHIVPLSQLNAAGLTAIMEAEKAKLSSVYGTYAWTGVRLEGPSAFNNNPTLRLDVTGRIAANDIKESGYASVAIDASKITKNLLTPS
jgi:hypothetical protein